MCIYKYHKQWHLAYCCQNKYYQEDFKPENTKYQKPLLHCDISSHEKYSSSTIAYLTSITYKYMHAIKINWKMSTAVSDNLHRVTSSSAPILLKRRFELCKVCHRCVRTDSFVHKNCDLFFFSTFWVNNLHSETLSEEESKCTIGSKNF